MKRTKPITWSALLALSLTAGLTERAAAQGRLDVDAVAGEPFGVGRITFELPAEMLPEPLGIEGIGLREKNGRALYPALDLPAFGKVMRGLLESDTPLTAGGPLRERVGGVLRGVFDRPPRTTLLFLFRGREPLELSLTAREAIPIQVLPRANPAAHRRLMQLWWEQYAKPSGLLEQKPDYPPMVQNYLTSTLARRLNFRLPEDKQTPPVNVGLRKELGLNLGTESLRMAMQQDRILGLHNLNQPADQPLPEPLNPPALELPPPAADVKIEPMAMRVPAQCFYVRFGSFANFLWLQDTLAKWGGDAQNLIALRGLDRGMSDRIEKQLVLKQTALSRLLGDTVVADVAIIGADMFFREGASYGILFQARNPLVLAANFAQQRHERISAGGVTEEKIKIGDKLVSYLHSPDGKVRSYYAIDGDYHFFSTSKELVSQFLSTASGKGALGASDEFRHARTVMPLSRGDTVWAYLSDAFFRNITSPRCRVEMARRLQAAADIELVQLAKLAAATEGRPGATIAELIAADLLPPDFGPLPGGSQVVLRDGVVADSVRGRLDAFVPAADVPVDKITAAERAEYERFAEYYRAEWGRMDPLMAGIKRNGLSGDRERVVIDVLMSPFAPQHFARLKERLGPASHKQLAPIAGDMAALDLVLTDQRVFGGLRDIGRPANVGLLARLPLGRLRDFLVGYVGTTGPLGLLGVLNVGIPADADPAGYAASPLGGWRRQFGEFTVFSFQRDVLETVTPQLRFEPAARPAQIRLHVADISQARITPALNDLGYGRVRETSLNNLRFLHAVDQQLHVPPAACREAAEFLLDGKLLCPLGGQYVLRQPQNRPAYWTSTALEGGGTAAGSPLNARAPQGFLSPPLNWFRGLDLDATMTKKSVSAHAEILMQMPPAR